MQSPEINPCIYSQLTDKGGKTYNGVKIVYLINGVGIAAQFTIAKNWKQRKCPSANEWIKKPWSIYTIEFYTAERKKELLPFTTA